MTRQIFNVVSVSRTSWHLEPGAVREPLFDSMQGMFARIDCPKLRYDLRRARRLVLKSDVIGALDIVDRIECCLADLAPDLASRLRADVDWVRAMGLALQDDCVGALRIARAMLEGKSPSLSYRAHAAALCHFAHWRLREIDCVYSLEAPRLALPYRGRHMIPAVITRCVEATIELERLRPTAAKRLAQDALDMAESVSGPNCVAAALPATIVGQVLYEQGCLVEANAMIRNRLAVINECGILECSSRAYSVLAGIAMHRGHEDRALALLQEAEALGHERGWPRLVAMSIFDRVHILLRNGQVTQAHVCAKRLDKIAPRFRARQGTGEFDTDFYRRMIHVQLAVACSNTESNVAALRQLHDSIIERGDLYTAVRLAVQLAICLDRLRAHHEADGLFQRTLDLGRIAGLYQVFVNGGKEIEPMLIRAYDQSRRSGAPNRDLVPYIESVLAQVRGREAVCKAERPVFKTTDCLSGRESDILLLVARGMSNKRIAFALTIAPETVKSHMKHIFIKLDVNTRAEAVWRAGSHGSIRAGFPDGHQPLRIVAGNKLRRRLQGVA